LVVSDGALLRYIGALKVQREPLVWPESLAMVRVTALRGVVACRPSAPTLQAMIADVKNPSGLRSLNL
jgi:hypothetical protein